MYISFYLSFIQLHIKKKYIPSTPKMYQSFLLYKFFGSPNLLCGTCLFSLISMIICLFFFFFISRMVITLLIIIFSALNRKANLLLIRKSFECVPSLTVNSRSSFNSFLAMYWRLQGVVSGRLQWSRRKFCLMLTAISWAVRGLTVLWWAASCLFGVTCSSLGRRIYSKIQQTIQQAEMHYQCSNIFSFIR